MTPGEIRRLYFIIKVFLSYGLDELIPRLRITLPIRLWRRGVFWLPNRHKDLELGVRLRMALEELGPVWIKFRADDVYPSRSLSAANCRSAGDLAGSRRAFRRRSRKRAD